MSTIIDELVTDRTQEDVDYVVELLKKTADGTATDEEREFLYYGPLKGKYTVDDVNRVESAVKFLADELVKLPEFLKEYAASKNVGWSTIYDVPYNPDDYHLVTKTDWDALGQFFGEDIVDENDLKSSERYLNNVVKLRNAVEYETDKLPQSINRLTYYNANSIEIALQRLYPVIQQIKEQKIRYIDSTGINAFSGEYQSGDWEVS